ncbi:hypothetical protein BJY52DRAFT_1303111, partial [Lactarius psammicola]
MAGSAASEEDMELDAYDDDNQVVPEARKTYEVDYKPLTHKDVKDLMNRSKRVTRSRKSSKKLEHTPFSEPFLCPIALMTLPPTRSRCPVVTSSAQDAGLCTPSAKSATKASTGYYVWRRIAGVVALDPFVHKVLSEDEVTAARYDELLVRNYVACNKNLKYCPFPSCDRSVSCPTASLRFALSTVVPTVSCGADPKHKFCFGCHVDGDHRPKCRDDSRDPRTGSKSNTKECSKCQSTIEKNGPWAEHGTAWYSCNRYDDKSGVDARDAQSRSRASLERYLHYYNRWANHEQSAKLSIELYMKTEKKMEEMQLTTDLTWIEVQFMKKAVDIVENCRTTLKWTYAMAYYLENGNQKAMFEDNQRDLEKAVEDLSELLEQPIEAESIPALRQKVTDKSVYVQKRNEILLEDTAKGYLEERWKWN